jgi:uncharacterized protein (DUF983 family)
MAGPAPTTRVTIPPAPSSFRRKLARALLRRCPNCGGRGWFTGWFSFGPRCVDCGYLPERRAGFVLGAVTINTVVTFGLIGAALVTSIVISYPELEVVPTLVVVLTVALVVPVVIYPFTHTIWAAADLTMRPVEPAEQAAAERWLAERESPR